MAGNITQEQNKAATNQQNILGYTIPKIPSADELLGAHYEDPNVPRLDRR
ncbi:MAG TPA: hypothetical protein PLE43_06020 [Alphaproteobacteria bacterium]|jgi:hypothetical protein|nr:hypothetical protein [Alphaproteobacteria bacterium]MCB9984684.1 hypothetical protein [Micavibrio sp.]HPQ50827.1 hypothetical protein [Alphaproteobacteria bacterium]HRK98015.1 hypothetical protein [Alphaproteobacteria bacterium]